MSTLNFNRFWHPYSVRSLLLLLTILSFALFADQTDRPLPANLTPEELLRLDEIGCGKTVTPPPPGDFFLPAEYDQADGVILSWDSYYASLLIQLIAAVTQTDTAYIVVSGASEQNSVHVQLSGTAADLSKVKYFHKNLNSVWIRDYGPWWGLDENGQRFILDFIYNRPRPLDDQFPEWLAGQIGVNYYSPNLVHAGGNFMVDGHGMGFMSSLVLNENSSLSPAAVRQIFREYAGLDSVVILTPMQYDGTGHIDMFCKLLNDSTVIVGEYTSQSAGAGQNYSILNQNAALLAGLHNLAGRPFHVHRILMPPYSNGITYTYTNSLIVNRLVLVPVYGFTTDGNALALYQQLMPEYTVLGFNCNQIIGANGAIHCITKLMMSSQPVDPVIIGDLNGDQRLNVQDIIIMVNIILGRIELTADYLYRGDLNGDQNITVHDIVMLVNILLDGKDE